MSVTSENMSIAVASSSSVKHNQLDTNVDNNFEFQPSAVWPDWFIEDQQRAWDEFLATLPPTRRDESWRFASIKALNLSHFRMPQPIGSPESIVKRSDPLTQGHARFVFANNQLIERRTSNLPSGVVVLPLTEAATQHEALFRAYFMKQPVELGSHKYAALHKAMLYTGAFIYVPDDVVVPTPIEIVHWVSGQNASVFPHTLVICGKRSKVTVIDHFYSADGAPAFACGINDLHVGAEANLHYVAIQDWSRETLAFHLNSTLVDQKASSTALAINLGGRFVRGESLSRMIGEGARSIMLSLNPIDGVREIDQRTLQDHATPGATSDLLYQNALDDQSRSIFSGLIRVEKDAHRTDAYQKVRNLLLSEEAEANSMPGLEILADDVRCTHGATTGEINEDELFYMQARGIPKEVARRMIVIGFFDSLLERVEDTTLRERLSQQIHARLMRSGK